MAKEITKNNPDVYGMAMPMDMGFIQRPVVKSLGAPGLCTADGEGPAAELLGEKSVLSTYLADYRSWIEDGFCYPLNTSAAAGVSYYDVDRGLSAVKDASVLRAAPATGYTSDKSGYMNLTTFGAIEYWQKPYDLADTVKPEVKDNSKDGTISLSFKDDTDIRFMIICIDTDGDGEYDEVIKTDYVLETSAASATGTPEVKAERTYELKNLPKDVKYYGYVLDDNNNKTTFGNGDPVKDLLDSFSKDDQDDTTDGDTGSTGNTGSTGDNTTGDSNTGSTGNDSTDATEGTTGDNTGSADANGGTAGGNTTGGSTSSSVNGNTGSNDGNPTTGNLMLKTLIVTTIVLVSAAIVAVMVIIGYKYKKLNGK